jgi:hypothetical protein
VKTAHDCGYPVAVETIDLSKVREKPLRQESLQTTSSMRIDIFYPPKVGYFAKNGLIQQPRLFSTVTAGYGVLRMPTLRPSFAGPI